ncbi:hypothetical protein K2173_022047 [Erythroxylum novogranatense]|uniref:Uncharacterized protein n=1 Tax=Erythroxylum novogranatense TaxID=1862640 RepID=A0AAV8T4G0_9ROSI|nr:hypothetical protein K2173_022047 [Erythroxylum novogranatense]
MSTGRLVIGISGKAATTSESQEDVGGTNSTMDCVVSCVSSVETTRCCQLGHYLRLDNNGQRFARVDSDAGGYYLMAAAWGMSELIWEAVGGSDN